MAVSKIWVLAEATGGHVATITLEMLAKARELAGTVECVYGGGDADAIAATLGAHGATKVLSTGDLAGSLTGVPVAAAMASARDADAPPIGSAAEPCALVPADPCAMPASGRVALA